MANTPTRLYAKRSTARSSMDSTLDDTISPRLSLDWRTALDRVPDGGDPFANELDYTEWTVQKAEETDYTYTDTTRNKDVKVIGASEVSKLETVLIAAQVQSRRFSKPKWTALHCLIKIQGESPTSYLQKSPTLLPVQHLYPRHHIDNANRYSPSVVSSFWLPSSLSLSCPLPLVCCCLVRRKVRIILARCLSRLTFTSRRIQIRKFDHFGRQWKFVYKRRNSRPAARYQ